MMWREKKRTKKEHGMMESSREERAVCFVREKSAHESFGQR
jgi:hypothetical protein